ncbi:MAG: alpha/beta hydrolase [Candidatus Obscuribacterales bacterium]|nr:alpha/beta hydrolase [Candidatus Obscuribacterales bacterium]
MDSASCTARISGSAYEFAWFGNSTASQTIVVLHEGLGCVELWRDFPERLAEKASCRVLAYSRLGHGRSDQPLAERNVSYLHQEAHVVLPAVLKYFEIEAPILWGHSDGASIALLYAAEFPDRVKSVVVAAPHLFVENVTVSGIRETDQRFEHLVKRLGRYHDDAKALFLAWRNIWLSSEFYSWNIENEVSKVKCPILAIQGRDDQYGTLAQVGRIKELASQTELVILDDCAHAPHQEQADAVLALSVDFVRKTVVSA